MNASASDQHVRVTWPWRVVAPALALIGVAYPFFVKYVEWRSLDRGDIAPPLFVLAMAVGYWWYTSHRALIGDEEVTFINLFGAQRLRWRDVATIRVTSSWVIVRDSSGRTYRVGSYAKDIDALVDRLRQWA